jgi:HK97 family phage major capsid protein
MKRFLIPTLLLDKGSENFGGGAVLDDAEFQRRVLGGMEATTAKVKTLEEKQTEILKAMPSDLKTTLEDIDKLKRSVNDSAANFDTMLKKLTAFDSQLRRHVRGGFTTGVQRIQADDELRARFNGAIRAAMNKDGDLTGVVKSITKALGEDASPGSTMIDDRLAAEIYDTLASYGIWNTFGVRRLGTKQTKFPVKTVRPVANFVLTEADTINDDGNKAGTSVTLEVELIAVLLNVSLQLLQDSEFDVTADVLNDFAEAYAYRLDYAAVLADGTADATHGGQTGILHGWTAANAAAGNTTVEKTELEDWTRTILAVDPVVLTRGARWWTHPQTLIRALSVKDGNGRSIFLNALEAPAGGSIGSILGYPVTLGFIMPTANSASTKVAAFGDPQSQVVGVRTDYVFEASDHHKWNTLQRSFRGYGRAGVKVRAATGGSYLALAAS